MDSLIYVGDVIPIRNDIDRINKIKTYLHNHFSIKDLGPLKFFLGVEAIRNLDDMVLSQQKYTLHILADCVIQGCRPSAFLMEQNLHLDKEDYTPLADASQC